jgi:hypothetical protein
MMVIECDICGFKNPGDPHFCGGCGVDMREPKEPETDKEREKTREIPKKKSSSNTPKADKKDENVIKWCAIRATCNSFSMTYPMFFSLVLSLAQGKLKLGFCGCNSCQQGYRELLAEFAHNEGRKNITASSREIVIKAREIDLNGFNIDISEFLKRLGPSSKQDDLPEPTATARKRDSGKIVIELDKAIIENTVLDVLSSEAGRKIIKEISKPRKKMRRVGFEPTDSCENRS